MLFSGLFVRMEPERMVTLDCLAEVSGIEVGIYFGRQDALVTQ